MPAASAPTAVTTPVLQSVSAEAGMIRPRLVSDSSSEGWMTTWSSSGSSVRSMRLTLQPTGFDDALQELLRARLFRLTEDLVGWALLENDARVEEADPVCDVAREAHLM